MYIYCERVLYNHKENAYEAVLDFHATKDLKHIAIRFGIGDLYPNSTILLMKNLKFKKYLGFRAGNWYKLHAEFFETFELVSTHEDNQRIFAEIEYKGTKSLNLSQYRTKYLHLDPSPYIKEYVDTCLYKTLKRLETPLHDLELIVRKVGCGNWNELKSKISNFWLIYDLGGDIKNNNEEMQRILNRVAFNDQPFIGVISHWDLDHYRGILDMDDNTLRWMKCLIAPTMIPNSLQPNKTIDRLLSLGIPIYLIDKTQRFGRSISLSSLGAINNIELFRSCDGHLINQSGIVLTIKGNNRIAILTGDHHYRQIFNYIINTTAYKDNHLPFELVVPHHGGNAGVFDESLWSRINFSSGAISTKSNRYRNMPKYNIHRFFVNTKAFHCTDERCSNSDYITTL